MGFVRLNPIQVSENKVKVADEASKSSRLPSEIC